MCKSEKEIGGKKSHICLRRKCTSSYYFRELRSFSPERALTHTQVIIIIIICCSLKSGFCFVTPTYRLRSMFCYYCYNYCVDCIYRNMYATMMSLYARPLSFSLSRSLRLSLIFKRGYFTVHVHLRACVCLTGFLFSYFFFQAFKIGIRLFVPIEFC